MCGNNRNYLVLPIVLLLGIVVFSSHLFAAEETIIKTKNVYLPHRSSNTHKRDFNGSHSRGLSKAES